MRALAAMLIVGGLWGGRALAQEYEYQSSTSTLPSSSSVPSAQNTSIPTTNQATTNTYSISVINPGLPSLPPSLTNDINDLTSGFSELTNQGPTALPDLGVDLGPGPLGAPPGAQGPSGLPVSGLGSSGMDLFH
ncbi:MAG: hypothetical protein JST54_02575 [Deltaproteobacteria bacterium]|nr:hypothetical protein [Deltaproteobacteria bacterium]